MKSFHDSLPNPVQKIGEHQIVKTPVALAERILDGFPKNVWSNKDYNWLVPVSKTGVFELCIYKRLMRGLATAIPNSDERRAWVVTKMIWSFCPTEACEIIVRRNYLGKVWDDIGGYMELEGNVQTRNFLKVRTKKDGSVMVGKNKNGEEKYVNFYCVVGNPPYQKTSNGRKGSNAVAIYPDFIYKAKSLQPKYLSMVIPGKWMTGDGQGTGKFLKNILSDKKLSNIVSIDNSSKWFPEIDLKGGAMYFMIDSSKEGGTTIVNGIEQDLSSADFIVVDPFNIALINKIITSKNKTFDSLVFGLCPYGIATNHNKWSSDKDNSYVCYYNNGSKNRGATRFIDKKLIVKNTKTINQWKVCTSKTSGKGNDGIGYTFIAEPGSIITHTYVLLAAFNSEMEAKNASTYLNSKFAHYIISILKGTINVSSKVFKFLPILDFTRSWADQELYAMFDLTPEEIAHIENTTKEFSMFREKKIKERK